MTAILMGSIGSAATTVAALETTITVADDEWFTDGTDDTYFGYGYNDALQDPLALAAIGSIGDDTYVDGSTTVRTISHVLYSENTFGLAASLEDSIFFGLVGVSIPDTDVTFREIIYNGQTYVRSDRDVYQPNLSSAVTYWQWQNVNPNGPTSGVRDFKVVL